MTFILIAAVWLAICVQGFYTDLKHENLTLKEYMALAEEEILNNVSPAQRQAINAFHPAVKKLLAYSGVTIGTLLYPIIWLHVIISFVFFGRNR